MKSWDIYQGRLEKNGRSKREAAKRREISYLSKKMPDSLSYHSMVVNGEQMNLMVRDSDNFLIKYIQTVPGGAIKNGSYVEWADSHWLVSSVDENNEIYERAVMMQCNYLLRWIADGGRIIERWCVVEDGTRYLTGETMNKYNSNGLVLGDTRISVTLPKDSESVLLGRDNRFLIDDYDSDTVLAYRLTKPFKVGSVFNNNGIVSYVMTEANTEDTDNLELHIANYYKYFPREGQAQIVPPGSSQDEGGKKIWL